ncbi:hypothetical protein [Microbulbifer yueqingensis]|uniref:Seed maturation protein n=1 Tax=Microbulbifer yueqingensis TaxID=658219 RepID=A0A1G9DFY5_9GAMM|nr:hypothetical protein [Microbulbifer yueqingensis]SDK62762.1 hypothetical protein SAMN05216212_2788 [Microbulbifer yueqingensis]
MAKAKKPMTDKAVRRIKSATAKKTGGTVPKDSFPARAESTVAKRNQSKDKRES